MKSLFEQMGGTYREENGYLIPNLTLPDEEQLKTDNQMKWVARMNNIRSRATEFVNHDIIYNEPKHGGREIYSSLPLFYRKIIKKV